MAYTKTPRINEGVGGIVRNQATGERVPRVVAGRPAAPPPVGGGSPGPGGPIEVHDRGGVDGAPRGEVPSYFAYGPGRSINGGSTTQTLAQQTAQGNVKGATPFMNTPGMQISQQRVSGQDIYNDPAVSAALQDFQARIAPGIQNRATLSGLGRSTSALNALSLAQGQMLSPMYSDAMGREERRLGNMNTAAENELGRRERSSARVADANQNQAQMLMQMGQSLWGRGQETGQNLFGMGGQMRDVRQQGNAAEQNDFLRRQALGEQAVGAPFGALAGAGLGSTTSSTGK